MVRRSDIKTNLIMNNKFGRKVLNGVVMFSMVLSLAPVFSGNNVAQAATTMSCANVKPGMFLKVEGKSAIFGIGAAGQIRYWGEGYMAKSWFNAYKDMNYQYVNQDCINSLPQPKMVPMGINVGPGTQVVKYDEFDQLYVVLPGNAVAPVSMDVAKALYGTNFVAQKVSLRDWPNLAVCKKSEITEKLPQAGQVISVGSVYYYVNYGKVLSEITANGMSANHKLMNFVRVWPTSVLASFTMGSKIDGYVASIGDVHQEGWDCQASPSMGTWAQPTGGVQTPPTPSAAGSLQVTLASANPANNGNNIVVGTTALAKVMDINFAAGGSDVVVNGVKLVRSGLSVDSDVSNVYLMDGNTVLASNLGISNGMVNFSNTVGSGLFKVSANSSRRITVAVTMNSSADGRTVGFSLPDANSVMSSAASVSGSYPLVSQTYQGTSLASNAGGLQITNSSAGTASPGITMNSGQKNVLVGQFTILGQNQPVELLSIKLTNIGSVNPTDLANIKLVSGGQTIATASTLSGNVAAFDLSNAPLQLSAGQSMSVMVYTDILGTPNRYFQLTVQNSYDVIARDKVFNSNILPTLNTGSFPLSLSYVSVSAGNLTVNRSTSSPSVNVLPGGTNQTLAKFDFTANGEPVTLTGVTVALSGSMNSSSVITNLKLIDDLGTQIGATQSTLSGNVTIPASGGTLNYYIEANKTRTISVIADLSSSATGTIAAALQSMTAQGFTSKATISVSNQTGNTLTANSTILTVSAVGGPYNVVAGQQNVQIGSFSLTAGSGSDVMLTNLPLLVNTGSAAAFQNLVVRTSEGTQVGNIVNSLTDGTTYNFSAAQPIKIPAGGSIVLNVFASVATAGSYSLAAPVSIPKASLSATVVSTNQAVSLSGTAAGANAQVVSAGTITASLYQGNGSLPSGQVTMGAKDVKLATYALVGSTNESIKVTDVTMIVTSSNNSTSTIASAFVNYRLMVGNTVVGQGQYLPNSTNVTSSYTWSGLSLVVPQNQTLYVDVVADANTWNNYYPVGAHTASTDSTTTVKLSTVSYIGSSSNQVSSTIATGVGNVYDLLRSTLVASAMAVPNSYVLANPQTFGTGMNLAAFTFSAPATADSAPGITTVTTTLNATNISGSALNNTFYLVDGLTNQVVSTVNASTTASSTILFTLNLGPASNGLGSGSNGLPVQVGSTRTLVVRGDLTGLSKTSANTTMSLQVGLSSVTWTDGTRTNLALSSVTPLQVPNLPVPATAVYSP